MATKFELSDAAIERRRARDQRQHRRDNAHLVGICGGFASLCYDCERDELDELREWAAEQAAPLPGEIPVTYWDRIDGPFLDAWWQVACERINAAA